MYLSVSKLARVKASLCKAPLCVCTFLCVKASVRKSSSVYKLLCVKTQDFSVQRLLCVKATVTLYKSFWREKANLFYVKAALCKSFCAQ